MSFCGQAPTPTVVEMTLANCIVVAGSPVQKAKQRVSGENSKRRMHAATKTQVVQNSAVTLSCQLAFRDLSVICRPQGSHA
jgi:hypothetical protein